VISTVDPEARHGHKTSARGFDGYKGHIAEDPDSEIITATEVTAGNHGDAEVAADLVADVLPGVADSADGDGDGDGDQVPASEEERPAVYGDASYGAGEFLKALDDADAEVEIRVKVQSPVNTGGRFTKDAFDIDLDAQTVRCPAGRVAPIRRDAEGDGTARFGQACSGCALAAGCTKAAAGRQITVGRYEALLASARARCADPAWQADYRANRPKVERKLAHLMRRRHGGRRARVRGRDKVAADFSLLAAAANLARLAVLSVVSTGAGAWAVAAG
jgi:hypothetical protein